MWWSVKTEKNLYDDTNVDRMWIFTWTPALRAVGKLWICTESECFCSNLSVSLDSSSSEKTKALHEQLDSLQALREQLEETLARSRETALAVDRAALVQADYGGGTRQSLASGPAGGADTNLNEALVEHEGS